MSKMANLKNKKGKRNRASEVESSFDVVLPKQSKSKSKKFSCNSLAGVDHAISVARKNKYHQAIFFAFTEGLQSEWFEGLGEISKKNQFYHVRSFINWINRSDYRTCAENRYECFKNYESFCLNEKGHKSSGISHLNRLIQQGFKSPYLSNADLRYLRKLIKLSKPTKSAQPEPYTLAEWFNLPWLRSILGENIYLQLESPKRLILSFRVTIAVTLLFLLEIRQRWQQYPTLNFNSKSYHWHYNWNPLLMQHLGEFEKTGEPKDDFTKFLWEDLVIPRCKIDLKFQISKLKKDKKRFKTSYCEHYKNFTPWQKPQFFHPDFQKVYSPLEERLLSWLVACEAIQPMDIPKLKASDYAIETNSSGRLIAMECTYYKGRSGMMRQAEILMATYPWTQALYFYIGGLPQSSSLFNTNVAKPQRIPIFRFDDVRNNPVSFLIRMWKMPVLHQRIHLELKRYGAAPLFLEAMFALTNDVESQAAFRSRTKKTSVAEYRNLVSNALPSYIFSLTHIKNSAVHAGSDKYRESDLINHHSHTSETEKHAYLTDANKDFVNRAGRITRLVLHDLQNVVYQPSITTIQQAVNDRELRTRLIKATETTNVRVHTLEQPIDSENNEDTIIVVDSIDNALQFIHYIAEAERMLQPLLKARPDWVERTLIVYVEWMTRTLSSMRHAKKAQKLYANLRVHLPPLFDHLLETLE